ncbi:hypothetical protein [Serratia phage vB_SmaS_Opt-169]|uniref:Uncharacterized protein n=1 Tax=Serratia phage vB_SmaS_Rovert TaxID=2777363 RepID=A0A7T3TL00_9CAUD|nr:hypothetical protein QJS24_gp58 [Serratia phage vB_SmaS_Rovert]QPX75025.1 hypothetical protein [Serratia phage vB_SmaS_Rovert]QPX75415.1 hypothetical protein [Serratia phage vB_SmaS_Opt-169]UGO51941.1 hypothetical protein PHOOPHIGHTERS_7 [Serratia phage vB_SmaS_PhooPhighters]
METLRLQQAGEVLNSLRENGYKIFLDARNNPGVFPLLHPTSYNSVMAFRDELRELLKKEKGE